MNDMTDGHTVKSFNSDMNRLHQLVLRISELARNQITDAVQCLEDEDISLAREVISKDQEINALDVKADEEVIRIIAKRQPMARDLREIMTINKIVADIERVGDLARRVARLTLHFYDGNNNPPNSHLLSDIPKIAAYADLMLEKAVRAFDELDPELALEVIKMDADLNEEFRSSLRRLSTYLMEDARSVGHVTDVVLGLRSLERIGSHAKNIARYVVFLVKGKDVRHESLEVVSAEVLDKG
ncbi:MAG: phosphate transport system regulatory protein PhoU [Sedimenticola sp.]|nr:MAG: phosphate transport system regulatory protein PhoU [Sedimenticola sp.]